MISAGAAASRAWRSPTADTRRPRHNPDRRTRSRIPVLKLAAAEHVIQTAMKQRERYLSMAESERPVRGNGTLRVDLDHRFDRVARSWGRFLQLGAGAGSCSFSAAATGAPRVAAPERTAAGSHSADTRRFKHLSRRLGRSPVELRKQTLQEFDPGEERFGLFTPVTIHRHELPTPAADGASRPTVTLRAGP